MADLDAVAAIMADPEVTRFFPGGPRTREQTRARLEGFVRDYGRVGFSKWAVVLRNGDELVGRCGPAIETVGGVDEVEIGYDLAKHCWGRGLATEAAAAAIEHCFGALRMNRVISIIDPNNIPSLRVAARLGMKYERDIEYRRGNFHLYSKSR